MKKKWTEMMYNMDRFDGSSQDRKGGGGGLLTDVEEHT